MDIDTFEAVLLVVLGGLLGYVLTRLPEWIVFVAIGIGVIALVVVLSDDDAGASEPPVITHSHECAARYDDEWCAKHAATLNEAKAGAFEHLVVREVGGVSVGDTVEHRYGTATVGVEDREVLAATYWSFPIEAHALVTQRLIPCESDYDRYADNPISSASGYFQLMASVWGYHPEVWDHVATARHVYDAQGPRAWECN